VQGGAEFVAAREEAEALGAQVRGGAMHGGGGRGGGRGEAAGRRWRCQ